MDTTSSTLGKGYGLRRDNFILDPLLDIDCFARDDIRTNDIAELRQDCD